MLSNAAAFAAIEGYFYNNWTHTSVEYPGVVSESELELGVNDYVKLAVHIGKSKAEEIGADSDSGIFEQGHGIVSVVALTRAGNGDVVLFDYQDKVYALLNYGVGLSGISFTEKESVGPHLNTEGGDWRMLSIFVSFHFSRA